MREKKQSATAERRAWSFGAAPPSPRLVEGEASAGATGGDKLEALRRACGGSLEKLKGRFREPDKVRGTIVLRDAANQGLVSLVTDDPDPAEAVNIGLAGDVLRGDLGDRAAEHLPPGVSVLEIRGVLRRVTRVLSEDGACHCVDRGPKGEAHEDLCEYDVAAQAGELLRKLEAGR